MQRRTFTALLGVLPAAAWAQTQPGPVPPTQPAAQPATGVPQRLVVQVWKGPSCQCCNDWIKHLETNGFEVRSSSEGNTDARKRLAMPEKFGSCHTGLVEGYTLEGHVPAREVLRLLKEKPRAVGLAVPAMPVGSPGMDGPAYGSRRDPYDVLLVSRDGSSQVFASYR